MTRIVVQVRVSEEEKAAWVYAAGEDGLSEWMRIVLNAASGLKALPILLDAPAAISLSRLVRPICSKCARQVRIGGKADDGCQECSQMQIGERP